METLEKIKQLCRESWSGETGEQRAVDAEAFILGFLPSYAGLLGISQQQVLDAIEAKRTYSAVNYYQQSNFPSLDGVKIFDTKQAFAEAAPSKQFRCPSCGGVSSDPYECDASKDCDWKSYGLFGTLGKGVRIVVKDTFLEHPRVHEIFMPLEFEQQASGL
ncbi:hypothetical protein [Enterovibrio sp. 27052020O]|uniref:hypothetical protein n=1 Tax=Enterovibrio sp. 27052020O TaxID=3241166 RepID=UPI00388F10E8